MIIVTFLPAIMLVFGAANSIEDYLAQLNQFPVPNSAVSQYLKYVRGLQRSESWLAHLRYNVHQIHRRYNLPNGALNRVPDVVLAARLKHTHAVAGLRGAAHDRLGRFQAVGFGYPAIAAVVAPAI